MQKRTNKLMVTLNDAAKMALASLIKDSDSALPIDIRGISITLTNWQDVEMTLEGFDDQSGNTSEGISLSIQLRVGNFDIDNIIKILQSKPIQQIIMNQYDKLTGE